MTDNHTFGKIHDGRFYGYISDFQNSFILFYRPTLGRQIKIKNRKSVIKTIKMKFFIGSIKAGIRNMGFLHIVAIIVSSGNINIKHTLSIQNYLPNKI